MKLTESQEEYLKTIYILSKNNKKVRVTDIANKLAFKKPSVNKGVNALKELGLLNYEAYKNIELTKKGEETAKDILKRYDILNMFLTEVLEIDEEIAQKEAKAMKYAMSEETTKKLDQYISKILDLGDLDCGYNSDSEKCRACVKITAKNRLKREKQGGVKC